MDHARVAKFEVFPPRRRFPLGEVGHRVDAVDGQPGVPVDHDPLGGREVVHILGTGALAVIVGFSWQVIAGIVTGDPTAYLATELAWRRNWLPGGESGFVPFEGFVQALGRRLRT